MVVAALLVLTCPAGAVVRADDGGGSKAPDLSRARVLWDGGFESGDFTQWSFGVQQKAAGRASIVTNVEGGPVRAGKHAARFEVRPGDNNVAGSGVGERAELLLDSNRTAAREGAEQWWAFSAYFPKDFAAPAESWNVFTAFHHTGSTGQANVHFDVRNRTYLGLRLMGGSFSSPTRRDWLLAPLQRGKWYDFLFHVRWSSRADVGFVEVYVDGYLVVPRAFTPTLYAGQSAYLKGGYYRAPYGRPTVVYLDGTRLLQP